MRSQFFTPHQFEPLAEFVDTLLVRSFSPEPLDLAVPLGASDLISAQIAHHVMERLSGRSTYLDGGANLSTAFSKDSASHMVQKLQPSWPHPIHFCVWMADRMGATERTLLSCEIPCLMIDWWQWFVQRIPPNRLSDAWMYLSMSIPEYRTSQARKNLQLEESLCDAMAGQGQQLMQSLTVWVVEQITEIWHLEPVKKIE